MTFDYDELSATFDEIERKLGYLKGNELAWDYLVAASAQLGGLESPGDDYMLMAWPLLDCVFPVPGHEVDPAPFFEFDFWVPRDVILDSPDPTKVAAANEQYMKDVVKGAVQAWHNGASWASGLAPYCRQVCDSFTRADAGAICRSLEDLHTYVTSDFSVPELDDPYGIEAIRTRWTSRAGSNFNTFYANYDGQIAQMALACVQVAHTFAAAAFIIQATQQGVLGFARSMARILDQQLEAWAPSGPAPQDPPEEPPWVADVTAIVTTGWDVLGHVPVFKDLKGQIDAIISAGQDVSTFATTVANVTGTELLSLERSIDAADSDELYHLLTDTLYDDYQRKYVDAMDSLRTGTSIDPSDPSYEPPVNTSYVLLDTEAPWFTGADMPSEESML